MTINELILLMPQLILVIAGMVLMLLRALYASGAKETHGTHCRSRDGRLPPIALLFQWNIPPRTILQGMLLIDNFSIFFQWLFLIIAGVSAFLSMKFNEREAIDRGEYYALLLFACSGMSLMAASGDLILTFLGIEILSIATYILAGFKRDDIRSNESSLKYFLLGSFATAILLYGIALIYGSTGSTNYQSSGSWPRIQGSVQTTTLIGHGAVAGGFRLQSSPGAVSFLGAGCV